MQITINASQLILEQGDITSETTDAIVNAANSRLAGGGGVDGAIHRAGGPSIMQECRKIGGCPTGHAVITTAGKLKAKYIIHTVGPIYKDGTKGEDQQLKSAYLESLKLASEKKLTSISFPAISTGAYGYPLDEAAEIALTTIINYFKEHQDVKIVRFILYDHIAYDIFTKKLHQLHKEHSTK